MSQVIKKVDVVPQTLKPPKWLTKKFLEKFLREYFHDDQMFVKDFSAKSATASGDNYASNIYRVNVRFTDSSEESSLENDVSFQFE